MIVTTQLHNFDRISPIVDLVRGQNNVHHLVVASIRSDKLIGGHAAGAPIRFLESMEPRLLNTTDMKSAQSSTQNKGSRKARDGPRRTKGV